MQGTGVHPREKVPQPEASTQISVFNCSLCFAGLAALILGLSNFSLAADYDPTQPRVEEVPDEDGSTWKVLIVPRPLHPPHPALRHAQSQEAEPKQQPYAPLPEESAEAEKSADEPAAEDAEASEDEPAPKPADREESAEAGPPFGVEIVPRYSYPPILSGEEYCPPAEGVRQIHPGDYLSVYASIPFFRSEYVANPSYRHDATMEILLGQLRPMVAPSHPPQPRPHETLFPFENDIARPYSYYSLGPGVYRRGPFAFGAPGAYGVNYNFYYPMPTVYRAY